LLSHDQEKHQRSQENTKNEKENEEFSIDEIFLYNGQETSE